MPTVVDKPPADIGLMKRPDKALAIWVQPKLIVEVFFQGIGGQGLLRQPALKAIRSDKSLADLGTTKAGANLKKAPSTRARARAKKHASTNEAEVAISHPDREVFPKTGITKGDVAAYYRSVAQWMLPEIANRPLAVVVCPEGAGKACFFQKHVARGWGPHIHGVAIKEEKGVRKTLYINDETGLLELAQMNVLEIHPWGSTVAAIERADRIVFDLDPHPTVRWSRVIAGARDLRAQLESVGLESFVRTSGGKGLHVVVPVKPALPWEPVKAFAHAVAQAMAHLRPTQFVSVAGEKNREGKIFVDWLRNARGATSVASYSLRARTTAGVAMPVSWEELGKVKSGDAFTIKNALQHISKRDSDPWSDIAYVKQAVPKH